MKTSDLSKKLVSTLLALVLLSQSGCVTRNLWEDAYFVPARPADLRLYTSTQPGGIVVEYNERVAGGKMTGRRSYSIQENAGLKTGTPPIFIRHPEVAGLEPLRTVNSHEAKTSWPAAGCFAVVRVEENEFDLYVDGDRQGTWKLPCYWKRTKPLGRALLTPAAILTDTAIVVGVFTGITLASMGR